MPLLPAQQPRSESSQPDHGWAQEVIQLQRTVGNRATGRLLAGLAQRQPTQGQQAQLPVLYRLLQRKLDGDALNVVGEDPQESDRRRGREKAFVKKKAGLLQYWKQSEFAVKEGDPEELRALNAILNDAKVLVFIQEELDKIDKWTVTSDDLKQLGLRFNDLQLGRAKFTLDKDSVLEVYCSSLRGVGNEIAELWPGFVSDILSREKEKAVLNQYQLIKKRISGVNYIAKQAKSLFGDGDGNVNVMRAKAMHKAASTSRYDGVWKVDDFFISLIRDARDNSTGGRPYNIMKQGEFNDEYRAWKKSLSFLERGLLYTK